MPDGRSCPAVRFAGSGEPETGTLERLKTLNCQLAPWLRRLCITDGRTTGRKSIRRAGALEPESQ